MPLEIEQDLEYMRTTRVSDKSDFKPDRRADPRPGLQQEKCLVIRNVKSFEGK